MDPKVVRYCPHCGNTAPQALALEHKYEDREVYDSTGAPSGLSLGCRYEARICSTCKNLILYYDDEASEPHVVYPSEHLLDPAVPPAIRECYEEASRIRRASPSAYAVLLRRGLEAICDDRGAKPATLHDRLAELTSRGDIPIVLSEMTAILRTLGNAGAHTNKEQVTVPMTWAMDGFFRAVVEYVYVAPSKVGSFKTWLRMYKKAVKEA